MFGTAVAVAPLVQAGITGRTDGRTVGRSFGGWIGCSVRVAPPVVNVCEMGEISFSGCLRIHSVGTEKYFCFPEWFFYVRKCFNRIKESKFLHCHPPFDNRIDIEWTRIEKLYSSLKGDKVSVQRMG